MQTTGRRTTTETAEGDGVPPLSEREHLAATGFGCWLVAGLFVDGWAHANQRPETFFTPWHGILYSGFAAAAAYALLLVSRRHRPGISILDAIPAGHGMTLAGLGLFSLGAVGDLLWHVAFGVEVSIQALLSPTHLVLMVAGLIVLSAPLRAAWTSPADRTATLRAFLAPLGSLTLLTALTAFFVTYASPFEGDAARFAATRTDVHGLNRLTPVVAAQLRERWALGSILITTVVLIVPLLVLLRRWRPPFGSITILYGVVILLETGIGQFRQAPLTLTGIAAGLVVDTLIRRGNRPTVIAPAAAATLWLTYFAVFQITDGVGWSPELWAGITLLAILEAAALALIANPPALPDVRYRQSRTPPTTVARSDRQT
jgi:hypothetical protein